MDVINVHEAKTNFSKLLERVSHGARLEPMSVTAGSSKVIGGGFRLQEKVSQPLTPEYLNKLAESKYND